MEKTLIEMAAFIRNNPDNVATMEFLNAVASHPGFSGAMNSLCEEVVAEGKSDFVRIAQAAADKATSLRFIEICNLLKDLTDKISVRPESEVPIIVEVKEVVEKAKAEPAADPKPAPDPNPVNKNKKKGAHAPD